jgi:type I restriction enzyme S subunit
MPQGNSAKKEQQKIVDCLFSLDTLIAAQTKLIDVLKNHKKGLMQRLFPRESEAIPRLRFPEFRNVGEWTTKELGKLGEVLMCKRIFADQTNDQGDIPFFKIGTLGGEPDSYISKELFEKYKTNYNYPKKDEVLITCSGTVGKCLCFDGKDAYFQDSNIVWIDNPALEISNKFLHLLLLNVDWSRLNSTTITRIYGSDLRNLSLTFPSLPEEQKKIAECLSSLDALIVAHVEKLDILKTHKKGLMQQLFPSPETVAV